jgi:hypothetical protein
MPGICQCAAQRDVVRESTDVNVKAIRIHVVRQFDNLPLRSAIAEIIDDQDETDPSIRTPATLIPSGRLHYHWISQLYNILLDLRTSSPITP